MVSVGWSARSIVVGVCNRSTIRGREDPPRELKKKGDPWVCDDKLAVDRQFLSLLGNGSFEASGTITTVIDAELFVSE